tara:strand:- start:374 stop:1645 length:1272 start_codon:yes stop_codon:yes gene_type:complete
MNIGLIGSGGREHAICRKVYESKLVKKIFCLPGNPGTSQMATNIYADLSNFKEIYKIIKVKKIDLVIIGPEEPLVKGLVDFLIKRKIKVFGPNKFASKLEGSKAFMKNLCKENGIPTAKFKICKKINEVKKFLKISKLPLVVKADGLAAGKGVTICKTEEKVLTISKEIFEGKFKSSNKLVLEEFLVGPEVSYFVIVDKYCFKFFGTAQDHKQVKEKDKGANTGGMGAYSPAPIVNKILEKKIIKRIIEPTLKALKRQKNPYRGFLYVGLMIVDNEPHLIEFNVRMGDPECQVILPRLKSDFLNIIYNATINNLKKTKIKWKNDKSMTIVLCAKGYPGKYIKNISLNKIKNIKFDNKIFIYHAGTKFINDNIVSNGGRVLNFTSTGSNFLKIRGLIIKSLKKFNWKSGFYRKDIGWKIINKKK